jgi:2-polyprenyl-3-methyl-5-hydroxy-6-metoxy-1,4-benzoquinol methylase
MANFSKIAAQYEKDSLVQKTASEILLDLLAIQPEDTVLDIGCGTGHITKVIGEKTTGRVVGIDPSAGMIEQAAEKYTGENISFRSGAAAGFLNQQYYVTELSQQYIDTFRDIVRRAFAKQADDRGRVRLHFYRIYLRGLKV